MSSKTTSRQSFLNHLEYEEKRAMQEEEHWIRANNMIRASIARKMVNKFRDLQNNNDGIKV